MSEFRTRPRIHHVTETIWISNIGAASDQKVLSDHGIRRVLSVLKIEDAAPVTETLRGLNISQKIFSIDDGKSFDDKGAVIWDILPWMFEATSGGEPLLVHCHAGISRSSSMIIAYCAWRGLSADDAVELVLAKNPLASPDLKVLGSFLGCIRKSLSPGTNLILAARWQEVSAYLKKYH